MVERIKDLTKQAMDLFIRSGGRLIESFTLAKEWERLADAVDSIEVIKDEEITDTLSL